MAVFFFFNVAIDRYNLVPGSEVVTLQNLKCVPLVWGQDNMKNLTSLEVTGIEDLTEIEKKYYTGNWQKVW